MGSMEITREVFCGEDHYPETGGFISCPGHTITVSHSRSIEAAQIKIECYPPYARDVPPVLEFRLSDREAAALRDMLQVLPL